MEGEVKAGVGLRRMSSVLSPLELDRLRVVLVSTRNPLNIGAAARALSNFGFQHLRVVNPYSEAFRRARSAVGAADVLLQAQKFKTVAAAVADCKLVVGTTAVRHRELQHPVRRLEAGGKLLRKQLAWGPVALLFGSERFGLSNEDLSHCDWLMRIPTVDKNISMNLGQAVAVCLFELARDGKAVAAAKKTAATAAVDLERLTQMLLTALHQSGYVKPQAEAAAEEKTRRLIKRMKLEARDADVWMGMLRQMLWKIGQQQKR